MADIQAPGAPRNERTGAERARITEMTDIPRLSESELERLQVVASDDTQYPGAGGVFVS